MTSWWRTLTVVLACVFMVSCGSDGGDDARTAAQNGRVPGSRDGGHPPVLLTTETGLGAAVTASGLTIFDDTWPGAWGSVTTSDEAAATIAGGTLIVVSSDGSVSTTDCVDCAGVVWSDQDDAWLVTRDRRQPDLSVNLMRFSTSLELVDEVVVERIAEEQDPDVAYGEHMYTPPRPVLYADGFVYLAYLSMNGGARGGPDVLARHDVATGRLVDFTYVGGLTSSVAVSDDGATIAVVTTGSGGACVTVSGVQLFEADSMREVPVDRLMPADEWQRYRERAEQPVGEFEYVSEPWLTILDAQWVRDAFVVIADAHNPMTAGCDEDPEAWVVAIDANDGTVASTTPMADVQAEWDGIGFDVGTITSVNGTCDDLVVAESWGDGLARVIDGSATNLASYGFLGGGSRLPDACGALSPAR